MSFGTRPSNWRILTILNSVCYSEKGPNEKGKIKFWRKSFKNLQWFDLFKTDHIILSRSAARSHTNISGFHCVKRVLIRSFSGLYFPAFGLHIERYGVSPRIQSECGKIQTRKTLNTGIFRTLFRCLQGSWLRHCCPI